MYSGLNPDSRNSSKVLRPPGGGSSDIFGLKEAPDQSKDKEQEVIDQPTDADESPENEETAPAEEGSTVEESDQTALPEAPAEPPVQTPSPPVAGVRGRIPPGGHSSGSFW